MQKPISRRPTMRDVADAAGVSLKTVSRVVNNEIGVSQDLVLRVDQAVTQLRYVPDERARTLRLLDARPSSIGFVMSDVSNPFFSSILRGLEETARARHCLVLSASSDNDDQRQSELIQSLIQRRVAGLIVVSSSDDLHWLAIEDLRETPLVFLDCEPAEHSYDSVRTDHHAGAVAMVTHLIKHGHRHIGFLGDDSGIFSARLRLQGYYDAMNDAQLPIREDWVRTGHLTPQEWTTATLKFFDSADERPTAVVAAQNFVTIGTVRALHQLGLQHQIALVGLDDIELGDLITPGISVLPQRPFELGRRAGELLFKRLDGARQPAVRDLLLSDIVARGSGELPPSR
jgi:LacI family transcriptional regulator